MDCSSFTIANSYIFDNEKHFEIKNFQKNKLSLLNMAYIYLNDEIYFNFTNMHTTFIIYIVVILWTANKRKIQGVAGKT